MGKKWNIKTINGRAFYKFDGVYEEDSEGDVWDDNDDYVTVTVLQRCLYYHNITPYVEEKEKTMKLTKQATVINYGKHMLSNGAGIEIEESGGDIRLTIDGWYFSLTSLTELIEELTAVRDAMEEE